MREVRHPAATGTPTVHETATVGHGVCMGHDVLVSAYSIVGAGVVIGEGCVLSEHAVLRPRTVIGPRSRIDSFAVIGGDPQDLGFDRRTDSRVTLGDGVVLREGVTIHRSTIAGGETVIEDGVYIMANGHVAHDCHVGKRAILANNVLLAGHVEIGDGAILGGAVGVHQHTRVGQGCMIGGNSTVTRDVPPFTTLVGRNGLAGLNLVGLRRQGVSKDDVADLKNCFRAVYGSSGDPREGAAAVLATAECGQCDVGRTFLEFFAGGTRGFVRPRSQGDRCDD